jgi:hypothetical protein
LDVHFITQLKDVLGLLLAPTSGPDVISTPSSSFGSPQLLVGLTRNVSPSDKPWPSS